MDYGRQRKASVVTKRETQNSTDQRNQNAGALDALEQARELPSWVQRTDALKKAGLLRLAADEGPTPAKALADRRKKFLEE